MNYQVQEDGTIERITNKEAKALDRLIEENKANSMQEIERIGTDFARFTRQADEFISNYKK